MARVDFTRHPSSATGGSLPWTGTIPDKHPQILDFLTDHLRLPLIVTEQQVTATDDTPEDVYDKILACEQFIAFFCHLSVLHICRCRAANAQLRRLLNSTFHPFSLLYELLADNPQNYNLGVKGVRYIKDCTSMACLLYINCTLWDYRTQTQRLDRYLHWLSTQVRHKELDTNRSVEVLLWILWRDGKGEGDDYDDPDEKREFTLNYSDSGEEQASRKDKGERSWLVSRMLRVAKRLGDQSWDKVREVLLKFLRVPVLAQEAASLDEAIFGLPWGEDELRMEILGEMYGGPPELSTGLRGQLPLHSRT
jgi:hypothetical protein